MGNKGAPPPCNCVLRAVFRACYHKFIECSFKEKHLSQASLEYAPAGGGKVAWGRKDEEFIADFYLVSRRHLDAEDWKVFRYHFLLGADWRLYTRFAGSDRGNFYHTVYRIEQKLGRVFKELKPYALFPVDEYYNGRTITSPCRRDNVVPIRRNSISSRLNVPVRRAA